MDRPDLLKAVSDSSFFQAMEEDDRVALARDGQLVEHGDGDRLFQPRQVPHALYLVVDGLVEISRREIPDGEFEPVAYAGVGAVLGASKVITGTPYEALAKFPEGGETLQWSRPLILRRIFKSRTFSMQYLQNLASRFESGFANLSNRGNTRLGGRLDHFDLATILQTVVDSGASGVLVVADAQDNKFGSIYIEDRQIGAMLCGALSGREAFYEILITPPERGTFAFSSARRPPRSERQYEVPPLLLEAARMQDEFRRFRSEVPGDVPLRSAGRQLERSDARDLELIERIWNALAVRTEGWERLAVRLPYSHCQVALAVRDLIRAGKVVVAVPAEPGDSGD